MRYYKCDECGVEKLGTPETVEDIVVGNLRIAIMVYKNSNSYDCVDLCDDCKILAVNNLRSKLNESAGSSKCATVSQ